jgi:hypothetical protein
MATFSEIKEVRLKIDDPSGFINLVNASSLPTTPAPQTAYRVSGIYYYTEESPAVLGAYEILELEISDDLISEWIAAKNIAYAVYQGIKRIIFRLGKKMLMQKNKTGAESVEYTSLVDMLKYYKDLLKDAKDDYELTQNNNSGRWTTSEAPEIAGGNI